MDVSFKLRKHTFVAGTGCRRSLTLPPAASADVLRQPERPLDELCLFIDSNIRYFVKYDSSGDGETGVCLSGRAWKRAAAALGIKRGMQLQFWAEHDSTVHLRSLTNRQAFLQQQVAAAVIDLVSSSDDSTPPLSPAGSVIDLATDDDEAVSFDAAAALDAQFADEPAAGSLLQAQAVKAACGAAPPAPAAPSPILAPAVEAAATGAVTAPPAAAAASADFSSAVGAALPDAAAAAAPATPQPACGRLKQSICTAAASSGVEHAAASPAARIEHHERRPQEEVEEQPLKRRRIAAKPASQSLQPPTPAKHMPRQRLLQEP